MAVIGIDLGTTNSIACIWRNHQCELIPNALGLYLTPSVVSFLDTGEILVGQGAKERLITHPEVTFAQFKRMMGTSEVVKVGDKAYRAEELSAFVIRKLVEDAKTYLNEDIEEAIISVPAYFNDDQRWATKTAGSLAGIKVERLINEPSAAALSSHIHSEQDQSFLIVDFGGGTLDISVVDAYDNVVEILAIAGDNQLGGHDFDQAIYQAFLQENAIDETDLNIHEKAYLIKEIERGKQQLSEASEIVLELSIQGRIIEFLLHQEKLYEICSYLLERMRTPMYRALHDADMELESIDEVLLVGGSSKMPIVSQYLEYMLKRSVRVSHQADLGIAIGCGIAAGIKIRDKDVQDMMLSDICPFTLGIEITPKEEPFAILSPIIERNTPLPCSKQNVYICYNYSDEVELRILQGEHRRANKNLLLKSIDVKLPPQEGLEGEETRDRLVAIRFTYDINGILEVEIEPFGSDEIQTVVITNQLHRFSDEEIAQKLQQLQEYKHPKQELEKNHVLLERGERLFFEMNHERRATVDQALRQFKEVQLQGDKKQIHEARKQLRDTLDEIEFGGSHVLH